MLDLSASDYARRCKLATALCGGLLLFVHASGVCAAEVDPDEAGRQQQQLELLRERINGLQSHLQTTQGEHKVLLERLQDSEQKIGRLTQQLRVLEGRLQHQRYRLQALENKEAEQRKALQKEQSALEQQVLAAYATGRQEQLKILLNQQDPALLSRILTYYAYLNRERVARMKLIEQRLQGLRQTQHAIAAEETRLEALLVQQNEEKAALQAEQNQRSDVVDRLSREISDKGKELTLLRSDEKHLKALLLGIQEALIDIPTVPVKEQSFAQMRGDLPWPAKGKIRYSYGDPKIGGLRWDGIMIAAPEGGEIRSVHAGRVAFADWLRGFGLLLIVDHGDGHMTLYGHNQSLFKEAGDWVETGEPVATVGSTGGRKESGVYFAIRHEGKAVNPRKWCRKIRGNRIG